MIISDLNYLEFVAEETSIKGGELAAETTASVSGNGRASASATATSSDTTTPIRKKLVITLPPLVLDPDSLDF